MAFQMDILTEDLGIVADYVAVKEIQFEEGECKILCGVWLNRDMKKASKHPLKYLHFTVKPIDLVCTCPKAWAYEMLKTLEFFGGASDIME